MICLSQWQLFAGIVEIFMALAQLAGVCGHDRLVMQINRDLCPGADRKRSCRGVRRDNLVLVPTDNTVIRNIDAGIIPT